LWRRVVNPAHSAVSRLIQMDTYVHGQMGIAVDLCD